MGSAASHQGKRAPRLPAVRTELVSRRVQATACCSSAIARIRPDRLVESQQSDLCVFLVGSAAPVRTTVRGNKSYVANIPAVTCPGL